MRHPSMLPAALGLALAAFALPAAAQQPTTLTVDADGDGAFVRLGPPAAEVEIANAMSSTEWDLSFLGTSLTVNGGETGTAGVTVHCVCANADASDDEVQSMTPETEAADFDAVMAADVPADAAAWHPAAFAVSPWYRYNIAMQHLIWPTYNVYLVKRGSDVFKVQIVGYYGEDGTPRQITFRAAKL